MNIQTYKFENQRQDYYKVNSVRSHKNISFGLKKLICTPDCDEFIRYLEKKQKSIQSYINELLVTKRSLIGTGGHANVYCANDSHVVVRIDKKAIITNLGNDTFQKQIIPESLDGCGLPICINKNNDIQILTKVEGKDHSFPNWISKYKDVTYNGKKISQEDALQALNKLRILERYPMNTYIDLAYKLKFLGNHNYKVDMINPNNLLVDAKKHKFNLVDFWTDLSEIKSPYNTRDDMINLLLDGILHKKFYEALPENEKKELVKISKCIIKKCNIASIKSGLPIGNENIRVLLNSPKRTHPQMSKDYEEFYEIYKDYL